MTPSGMTFEGIRSTRQYFKMIPKQKITFAPPMPKYEIQNLEGASGELDYTEEITGRIAYSNSKGSIEFLVLSGVEYQAAYTKAREYFNGTRRNVVLDDDPATEYRGRFWVNDWKSYEGYSLIVIDYEIEPKRYDPSGVKPSEWLWDDLDLNGTEPLYYWEFAVDGEKWRTIYSPASGPVTPTFTCSSAMTVSFGGSTHQLPAGTTADPGFQLSPGENTMKFTGSGTVGLDYPMEAEE